MRPPDDEERLRRRFESRREGVVGLDVQEPTQQVWGCGLDLGA